MIKLHVFIYKYIIIANLDFDDLTVAANDVHLTASQMA